MLVSSGLYIIVLLLSILGEARSLIRYPKYARAIRMAWRKLFFIDSTCAVKLRSVGNLVFLCFTWPLESLRGQLIKIFNLATVRPWLEVSKEA